MVHNVWVKLEKWDPAKVRLRGWPGVPETWELKREKQAPALIRVWTSLPYVATYAHVWQYNHGYIAGWGHETQGTTEMNVPNL
jgi:hypothetical protein